MKKLLAILVTVFCASSVVADPAPEPPAELAPSRELTGMSRSEAIESMAQGVLEFKKFPNTDISNWYSCGEYVPDEEQLDVARHWASTVYDTLASYNKEYGTEVPVWGVFAVVMNESGMDECAVDFRTRNVLYGLGLLKKARNHITHSRDEIKKALRSPKWSKWAKSASYAHGKPVGVDIGAMQLRYSWGRVSSKLLDKMLTLDGSLSVAIPEMLRRSKEYPVGKRGDKKPHPRPWVLWPGTPPQSAKSLWYDKRITKLARKVLGAPSDVI